MADKTQIEALRLAEHYRNAIATACEGWSMTDGLRKHLESALWNPPAHKDDGFYEAINEMDGLYQAAPKAAPGEQNTVPAEWLEQAYREGWAACRDAETIGEEAEDWAFGNSTANSRMIDTQQAAPQQEAVAYIHVPHYTVEGKVRPVVSFEKYQQDYDDGIYSTRIPLYTAPQPAPAPLSDDVVKDAARWQMVALISNELRLGPEKSAHTSVVYAFMDATDSGLDLTAAIDAALAAQGENT